MTTNQPEVSCLCDNRLTTTPTEGAKHLPKENKFKCTKIQSLPPHIDWYTTLTAVHLGGTIPILPASFDQLTTLLLSNCVNLPTIPLYPNLQVCKIEDCNELMEMYFPESLQTLTIRNCNYPLLQLPTTLSVKSLHIKNCTGIHKLPESMIHLENLRISDVNLHTIPIVTSLTSFRMERNRDEFTLPVLENLQELYLHYIDLVALPSPLPELHTLSLYDCRSVEIPHYPKLTELNTNDDHLPQDSVGTLKKLYYLSDHPPFNLSSFQEIRCLDLSGCSFIGQQYPLPLFAKIETLYLSGCHNMDQLPDGMIHLRTLAIRYCTNLTTLPKLESLQTLDLEHTPITTNISSMDYPALKSVDLIHTHIREVSMELRLERLHYVPTQRCTIMLEKCPIAKDLRVPKRTLTRLYEMYYQLLITRRVNAIRPPDELIDASTLLQPEFCSLIAIQILFPGISSKSTLSELKKICSIIPSIKGYSKLKKKEVVELLYRYVKQL